MDEQTRVERDAVVAALARMIKPLMEQAGVHMACVTLAFEGPTDGATFVVGDVGTKDFLDFVDVLPELASAYRASVANNDSNVRFERLPLAGPGD